MLRMAGALCPSSRGLDFFYKLLGTYFLAVEENYEFVNSLRSIGKEGARNKERLISEMDFSFNKDMMFHLLK